MIKQHSRVINIGTILFFNAIFLIHANKIMGMELSAEHHNQSTKSYSCSPSRTIIQYACLSFLYNRITLDQLFDRVMPAEIVRYIIHCAYKKEFDDYFNSKDRLNGCKRFVYHPTPCDLNKLIQSLPNKVDEYTHFDKVTCVVEIQNRHYIMGWANGDVTMFNSNMHQIAGVNGYHQAAVSALSGQWGGGQGEIVIGYQDGSFAYFSLKQTITVEKAIPQPITCIASVSSDTYIVSGNDLIGIINFTTKPIYCPVIDPITKKPCTIKGIGTFGSRIFVQTTDNKFLIMRPYTNSAISIIDSCSFSPLQASYVYQKIQSKSNNQVFEPVDEEVQVFKQLPESLQAHFES